MEYLLAGRPRDAHLGRSREATRTVARVTEATPSWLAALQPAGNRAIAATIQGILQRQGPTVEEAPPAAAPEAALLDAVQVADARRYYTSQPWRYTPAIIAQLRTALALEPAGGVDDALVLAVARFQVEEGTDEPELKIDGKAGPRTLPRIFRRGLNVPGQGTVFAEAVQGEVIDQWATLATPEARLAALVKLANDRLVQAQVPPVTHDFDPDPTVKGSFNIAGWQMLVGRRVLEADALSLEQAQEITGTVYHEARHAEQWFRMSQLRAGQGLSVEGIAEEIGIPIDQAKLAKAAPLAPGSMEALIAQGWWDSFAGQGRAHREATLTEALCATVLLRRAKVRAEADPSPENEAAIAAAQERRDRAFAAYQELPEENDAFATEHEASEAITSGSAGTPGEIPEGIGECPTEEGEAASVAPGVDAFEPAVVVSGVPAGVPSHEILSDSNLP